MPMISGKPTHREILLSHVAEPLRNRLAGLERLDEWLERLVADGRRRWPHIRLSEDILLAHVAARLPLDAEAERILELCAEDIYLACACACGDPAAIETFHRELGPAVRRAVARAGAGSRAEDLIQAILTHVLIPDGERPPGIVKYGGRGRLSVWLQVLALRRARRQLGRKRPEAPNDDDLLAQRAGDVTDVEMQALRNRYRADFKAALEHALASLTPRDRNMLRHELVERLSLERTAARYGVHRATAARWRSMSRAALFHAIRRYFLEKHGIGEAELQSIVRLIASNLELSLSRMMPRSDDE